MSTHVYHPDTTRIIAQLTHTLPHGIMLYGPNGVGLRTVAMQIAGTALTNVIQPTDREGVVTTDGSGEIRIPQIRDLLLQTRGKSTAKRVFVIDDADKMNLPAQQAFLKLLEEPTVNTHFILIAHTANALLPTIRSRVQAFGVKPITLQQSQQLIAERSEFDQRRTQQLLFLAEGRPAELTKLLTDAEYFKIQVTAVEDGRLLLQGSAIERATIAQKYHSDRQGALRMLEQAIRIIRATLKRRPTTTAVQTAERLALAHQRISTNGNIRLQLLAFVVQ